MLFSFPIMFLASLGCIYLHFQKKTRSERLVYILHISLECNTKIVLISQPRSTASQQFLLASIYVVVFRLRSAYTEILIKQVIYICCSNLTRRRWLDVWKRPLIVTNLLGIVSVMELVFAAMFIALLGWSLYNYLHVSFTHPHMHHGVVQKE